jgi:cytochrome c-type biogenesis protein CcmH
MHVKIASKFIFATIFGLLLALLIASAVFAQDEEPFPSDDDVNEIAKQMFCPVCENIPLDVCDTKACEQWRELIREKLGQGWSEEQIKDYFVLQYGDRVLAEPPARGLNWLVYILPPVVFLIGVYVVIRVLRNYRRAAVPVEAPQAPEDTTLDTYKARMEEALNERKKRND